MSDQVKIKQYWEDRGRELSIRSAATTDDIYLRELEILTLVRTLSELGVSGAVEILDAGCGNAFSTLKVVESMPNARCFGVDYSEQMIAAARRLRDDFPVLKGRVDFATGDVTALEQVCGSRSFDLVITDRCLINLESVERQAAAFSSIAQCVKPDGLYLAIENFNEGQRNMNRARQAVGLPEIPVRWHNLYFDEPVFRAMAAPYFQLLEIRDFSSSYYFATRVVYSAMCQRRGEKIDYGHEIHQLAVHLPWTGHFSPIRLAVMRRRAD
jgi:SAM-dependent methyltransferase